MNKQIVTHDESEAQRLGHKAGLAAATSRLQYHLNARLPVTSDRRTVNEVAADIIGVYLDAVHAAVSRRAS